MSALDEIKQAEDQAAVMIKKAQETAAAQVAAAEATIPIARADEEQRLEQWLQEERATAREEAIAEVTSLEQAAARECSELVAHADRQRQAAVEAGLQVVTFDAHTEG